MVKFFKKLMQKQIQEVLDNLGEIATMPQHGWIRVIRDALGMSSHALAKRMGCSQANIASIEKRERSRTISLQTLDQVAKAMNCTLVYYLVPEKPLNQLLEDQARRVAKRQIKLINHSMKLEQQGLTKKQIKQQEDDLVQELLQGSPKKLWDKDEI